MSNSTISEEDLYDISSVSRLTGLSASNLRMWEKRYQAVSPTRSETGRRKFTRRELQRLTLLKTLSDHGHSISSIAGLSMVELERRLDEAQGDNLVDTEATSDRDCRICVVGDLAAGLLTEDSGFDMAGVDIIRFDDLTTAASATDIPRSDLLIVECPAFLPEDVGRINSLLGQSGACRAIVIYGYSQKGTLEKIENSVVPITPIRTPVSPRELALACSTDLAKARRSVSGALGKAPEPRSISQEIPERRFDGEQLSAIAHISSAVECECPHHLSDLIVALNGFEDYSAACNNRNEVDAEVHAYLHRMTAHARAIVEDSLSVLLEYEGIEVGEEKSE